MTHVACSRALYQRGRAANHLLNVHGGMAAITQACGVGRDGEPGGHRTRHAPNMLYNRALPRSAHGTPVLANRGNLGALLSPYPAAPSPCAPYKRRRHVKQNACAWAYAARGWRDLTASFSCSHLDMNRHPGLIGDGMPAWRKDGDGAGHGRRITTKASMTWQPPLLLVTARGALGRWRIAQ